MIDVVSKRCAEKDCSKGPTYNFPNETKALYCCEHKLENMIFLVKKEKCKHQNCDKYFYEIQ